MKLLNLSVCSLCVVLGLASSALAADSLESGFLNPPDSAKPQTWWHWMNGNTTKAGITADLEAMKQIGLGGATVVIVDCEIPPGPVKFMSPEWREHFKFAVQEADRLGLKLTVENCAGWSSSGGPWNTATNAMQRLTSSETRAHGPAAFDDVLPQPPVTLGYYRDIAVLAFKAAQVAPLTSATNSTSMPKLEIKRATYGADGAGSADVTARVAGWVKSGRKSVAANSGQLGGDPAFGSVKQLRIDFTLDGKPGTAIIDEGDTFVFPTHIDQMAKNRPFGKTSVDRTFFRPPPPAGGVGETIPRDGVLDLTSKLDADGRLRWDVPAGDWIIMRLGHTPTGKNNHPAPREGTGPECDKMSKAALDAHWAGFMQKVLDDIGPLAGKTLDTSLIDSYEVGAQDWTPGFREEFKKRRGYDLLPFLPAFNHHVVENAAVTERFLWDMRRTIADLFAENYFGHFAELCRQRGLLNAVEPYTGPFESLQSGAPADVVMGEFWTSSQGHPSVKMAASIASIYGKTIVAAESFTASPQADRWKNDPYALKTLGDLMFCQGLNRYIFHRYAMQPWTDRFPGMTMGQWGFHFERTTTWWKQGQSWIDYISHCEYLLQQGRAVADAAYFTGESAPVEMRIGHPSLPAGYDYDAINADVLLHGAKVKNGRLTLASGANYAVLILPPDDINMTPQLLSRLRELVRDGATIIGPRPQHSPSLTDFPRCDEQVRKITEELWDKTDGVHILENSVGKGRVFWGKPLPNILAGLKLKPDFEFAGTGSGTRLACVHRVANDADIYFVSNQRRLFDSVECTFRVSGKVPELWHPDTGVIEPAPVWSVRDGRTTVRLDLAPAGSVFVVFRRSAGDADHVVAVKSSIPGEAVALPKLEIKRAAYSPVEGAGGGDVTARLAALAHDGHIVMGVNNDALGGDPAPNRRKQLVVDYVLDGAPGQAIVPENETLTLPNTTIIGPSPQWEPLTGRNGSPGARIWSNGYLEMRTARGNTLRAVADGLPAPDRIDGAWTLNFPPNWGAPPSVSLDRLASWTENADSGVRYFSGTATYEKEIEISADRLTDDREVWLDLGSVKNFAEVSLNGHDFGVLWKPPFRVNVTSAARSGVNKLVVKVTNLWPNRLIGDEQLPPDCEWNGKELKGWPQWLLDGKPSPTGRLTFTTWHHWTKDSPLLESGLLGPVTLRSAEIVTAN